MSVGLDHETTIEQPHVSAVLVDDEFFDRNRMILPPELPDGYGFKGGVARAALLWQEGYDTPIRDVDIIALGSGNDPIIAREIAETYMPRDYAYGDGVEIVTDIPEYFATRDFTINEVLLVDGVLHASSAAVEAVESRVIKGSDYEMRIFDGRLGPKLSLKAILLKVVMEQSTGQEWNAEISDDTHYTDFYIALAVNKAMLLGGSVPNQFLKELQRRGIVSSRLSIQETIHDLSGVFEFDEDEWPDYANMFDVDKTEADVLEDYAEQQYFGARTAYLQ